ncbi:hypothetical protein ACQEUR_18005 [Plantactinospora sp. CA-290183]
MATSAATAKHRVDLDGNVVPDAPPALYLMRGGGGPYLDDGLYIDGNFYPSFNEDAIDAEPFHSTYHGRRFGHGITWTEWLGGPLRHRKRVQAEFRLIDDSRLLGLLRAGHAAGFDMFTVDASLQPAVARRRHRSPRAPTPRRRRSRRNSPVPRAGASQPSPARKPAAHTSSKGRTSDDR